VLGIQECVEARTVDGTGESMADREVLTPFRFEVGEVEVFENFTEQRVLKVFDRNQDLSFLRNRIHESTFVRNCKQKHGEFLDGLKQT
jgi:hypothetical protein